MIDRALTRQFAQALSTAIEPDKIYNAGFYQQTGYADRTKPTERQIKKDLVGVFFRGLYQRADEASNFLQQLTVERRIRQLEFQEVEFNHPWAELLRSPSIEYSDAEFWQWTVLNYDLNGSADYVCVYDERNRLIELVPLFREFGEIFPVPSMRGGVEGWIFQRSDGYRVQADPTAFMRIPRRNPINPYETLSLIEAARFDLDEESNMREYRKRSTSDGGWEANKLTTPQELSAKQHQELSKELKQFIGGEGRGKLAVFSHGLKPLEMINARDMEYIQGKTQTAESIKDLLGTRGLGEGAQTRATAEAVRFDFIESTIAPLVRMICSQLTRQFEVVFGADRGVLKIRPPEMAPLDPDFEMRKRRSYLETGQRVLNDFLAEDGFDEIPEGNTRFIPLGWRALNETREASGPEEPERAVRKVDNRELTWRSIDKKKRREANLTEPAVNEFFQAVKRETLKSLRDKKIRTVDEFFSTPFDIDEFLALWTETVTPEIMRSLKEAYNNVMASNGITGLEFSLDSPQAKKVLQQIAEQQSTVPFTLFDEMSDKIREGVKAGDSNRTIMQNISMYFEDTAPGKIQNIANGLSTSAWEAGQEVAYDNAGFTKKEWLSSRDERVRDSHFEADGQVVDIGDRFLVGDSRLKHPGDPDGDPAETIGCRCSTIGFRE